MRQFFLFFPFAVFAMACSQVADAERTSLTAHCISTSVAPEQAIEACTTLIARAKKIDQRADHLVLRAEVHHRVGNPDAALADLASALRLVPRNVDALVLRGVLALDRNDFEAGIRDFSEVIGINPRLGHVWLNRAIAHERSGHFEAALADVDQALALDPRDVPALTERCWVRAVLNRSLDDAVVDCDTALAADSKDPAPLHSRGLIRYRQGEFARAITDFDASMAANPEVASSFLLRGLAKRALGDASAEADIVRAKQMDAGVVAEYLSYGITVGTAEFGTQ